MQVLTSSDNAHIKEVKALGLKKNRDAKGLFVVEGARAVKDAAAAGAELVKVFMAEGYPEKEGGFDCQTFFVADRLFVQMAETENPQGILAIVKKPEIALEEALGRTDFVVVLENVQDPGNVGTIIRTADAAGAGAVLLVGGCADVFNPKVVRSTMASLFHIPVIKVGNVPDCAEQLKENGFRMFAANLEGSSDCFQTELTGKSAFLLGNEGNGLSPEAIRCADTSIRIPMLGGAESLNVSVAAGILMFERLRQERL